MIRYTLLLMVVALTSCLGAKTIVQPSAANQNYITTPQQFGAIGDGKADDSKALQAAINFCITNKKRLYVPTGDYRIRKGLKINGAIHIDGERKDASYFWYDPLDTKPLITIGNGKTKNIKIENVKFGLRNFGAGKSNVHCIKVDNTKLTFFNIENVEFFGFTGYGLYLSGKDTYGQNLSFRDINFYRMGGMIGQNDDRGINNWWTNLVIFENINLDAYSGHSVNMQSPQKYLFDIRGWRTVSITNLLIEGSIKGNAGILASVRVGGGYQPSGSNYLGLGNVTINGYWEEWSSKYKPPYSIESIEGISSLDIRDYNGKDLNILADAQTVSIRGIRIHGLNTKDRIHLKGNAKVVLENVHNSSKTLVDKKFRANPNIDVRSVNDKY